MKNTATITVIGRDKTGVVARITGFLFHQHANIEALEEQVTRGQFSMTVQATWTPGAFDVQAVTAGLNDLAKQLDMEIKLRIAQRGGRQRMAIMVTKERHCFDRLAKAIKSRELAKAEPVVVIGNRKDLEPATAELGVPFVHIPWEDRVVAENRALEVLDQYAVDFIVLARFMKILSPNFVWRFKNKIINIHPSLLPSFPGPQAYRQAYEQGVKIIGVSAHFVTMNLDEGPIIAQDCFHVRPHMGLKEIVAAGQKREATALLRAVKLYLNKRLDVFWGVVKEV